MARRIGGAGGGSDPGAAKAGVVVAAAAVAVFTAAGSGGLSLGGSSTAAQPAQSVGQNLTKAKSEGRKSARKGDADGAWRQVNMRTLKRTAKAEAGCLAHSFGQVRDHFLGNPCKSLDRALFAVGDAKGNAAVVSVVWVGFHQRRDATAFKKVIDVHGSGDITPLAGSALGLTGVTFTGLHYNSRPDGTTVVIAESEALSGQVSADVLDAVADMASWLPR